MEYREKTNCDFSGLIEYSWKNDCVDDILQVHGKV